jgi:two-component system LytT family response regulator
MKIAIIDDNSIDANLLKNALEVWGEQNAVKIQIMYFPNGTAFLKSVYTEKFDLCFIDIYRDTLNGIQVAQKLRERDPNILLVFCTMSTSHMPDAFPCHAFDYLIKPIMPDRVGQILSDALKILPETVRYLELQVERTQRKLFYSDICFITSNDHYVTVNLHNGETIRARAAFGTVAEKLTDDQRFLQINRGVLINMDYVAEFTDSNCRMETGAIFPLHTGKRAKLQSIYLDYCFRKRETQIRRM